MNTTQSTWKLVRVYDLREVDFFTGKKIPLGEGEGNECNRCGKLHAKVYVVTDSVRTLSVGSTCVKHACNGWEPTAQELKSARTQAKEASEARREATLVALAQPLADAIKGLVVPEPKLLKKVDYDSGVSSYVWGEEDGLTIRTFDAGPLNAERLNCFREHWLESRVWALVAKVTTDHSKAREIVKKAMELAK